MNEDIPDEVRVCLETCQCLCCQDYRERMKTGRTFLCWCDCYEPPDLDCDACRYYSDQRIQPLHVYPVGDTREHNLASSECWCNPKKTSVAGETIIIHSAEDGRDQAVPNLHLAN